MITLYNFFIKLYIIAIKIWAIKNAKAQKMMVGRQNILQTIKKYHKPNAQTVWMHCASVGEYEQGLPILQALKQKYPSCRVVLTFFSSSGYEAWQPTTAVDEMYYLPFDTKNNAQQFIHIINPKIAIFVKYELWYHYLATLHYNKIITIMICMHLQYNAVFSKSYGVLHRKMLRFFTTIFVQDEQSIAVLKTLNINGIIAGDTRFDRMQTIVNTAFEDKKIRAFCQDNKIMIAGSTWPADELILQQWIATQASDYKLIIVPHEIDKAHIAEIKLQFADNITTYSDAEIDVKKSVLLIDKMGMLKLIYRYATVTYIGGGFGSGIHNILEPISYNKLVMHGPNCKRFLEAAMFAKIGAAKIVSSSAEIQESVCFVEINKDKIESKINNIVNNNIGATVKIVSHIQL
jgi:3-deoxy-D-manno-octulosonic-acid transferase